MLFGRVLEVAGFFSADIAASLFRRGERCPACILCSVACSYSISCGECMARTRPCDDDTQRRVLTRVSMVVALEGFSLSTKVL